MRLNRLELLETFESITRMKCESIGFLEFHASIEITSCCILEQCQMVSQLTDYLTLPLISKDESNSSEDISMLRQKGVMSMEESPKYIARPGKDLPE